MHESAKILEGGAYCWGLELGMRALKGDSYFQSRSQIKGSTIFGVSSQMAKIQTYSWLNQPSHTFLFGAAVFEYQCMQTKIEELTQQASETQQQADISMGHVGRINLSVGSARNVTKNIQLNMKEVETCNMMVELECKLRTIIFITPTNMLSRAQIQYLSESEIVPRQQRIVLHA